MTVSLLKIIASLGMLIDHIASVFGWKGWELLSPETTELMRVIGRFVFPVFAFLIVNGWHYTKDKSRYFSNLILFAIFSQIPFTLASNSVNLEKITNEGPNYFPNPTTFYLYLAFSGLFVFTYWYFALKKKFSISMVWIAVAPLLFALPLKWNYIWYSYFELNVLYTLALGMFAIYCYEKIFIKHDLKWFEYILLLVTFAVALRTIGNNSDYGILGIVLIFALYLARGNLITQAGVIAAWGMYFYGIQYNNWYSAWGTFIASALILFYNGKKGANLKYLFYIFYPAHLLILGIINIIFRFS